MAEEAKGITISAALDNGGGKRNLTVKTYRNANENTTGEVLPYQARSSSTGSCHDFCKYGIKRVYEDKTKRPALRRVINQMPNEELRQLDTVTQQHGRKKSELRTRPSQNKNEITVEQTANNQKGLPPEKTTLLSGSLAERFDQKSSNLDSEMTDEQSPQHRHQESSEGSVDIKCVISSSILEGKGSREQVPTSKSDSLLDEPGTKPNGTMVKNGISSQEFVPVIQVQKTSVASEGTKLPTSSEFSKTNLVATGSLEEPVGIELLDGTATEESIQFADHSVANGTKKASQELLADSKQLNNHRSTAFGKPKLGNPGGSTRRGLRYRRSTGTAMYDACMKKAEGQVERFSMDENAKHRIAEKKISDVTRIKILKRKEVCEAVESLETEAERKKPWSAKKAAMIVNHTVLRKRSSLTPRMMGASAPPKNSMKLRKGKLKPPCPPMTVGGGPTGRRLQAKMSNVPDNGEEVVIISTVPSRSHLNRVSSLKLKSDECANPELATNDVTEYGGLDLKERALCATDQIPEKVDIVDDKQDSNESPTREEEDGDSSSKLSEFDECISSKCAHQRNSHNLDARSESAQSLDIHSADQQDKVVVADPQPGNNSPRRLNFTELKNHVLLGGPTIVLRHQDVKNKKERQGLLFNQVIKETASKLVEEARIGRVKALVGAFETVISLQEK